MTTSASSERASGSGAEELRTTSREGGPARAGGELVAKDLRICFVTPLPPDRYSGANLHAVWVAERLADMGAAVEFVTFSEERSGSDVLAGRFPCHFLRRRFGRFAEITLWPNLAWMIRRREFDVVHAHSTGYHASFSGVAARLAGAGGVATIMLEGGFLAREGRFTPALHRVLLQAYDRIVPISDETREEAVRAGFDRRRLRKIPIGVDVERFRPVGADDRRRLRTRFGLPAEVPIVTFVGALCHRKNVLWLLETWLDGPLPARDALLLVVGDAANDPEGPEVRRELQARIRQAPRPIRWIPFVEDIEEIYALSDVLTLPSRREGMPSVVLQAMAAGLPVVSTPVSGVPELLGRNGERGWIHPHDDRASFRRGVQTLLDDGELRARVTRAARQYVVDDYSLEAVARAHLELYEELLAERNP